MRVKKPETIRQCEKAAIAYIALKRRKNLVCETTDLAPHGTSSYNEIREGLHYLLALGWVGSWSVTNGGDVWFLNERVLTQFQDRRFSQNGY